MEGSDQLGQVGDLDLLGDGCADSAAGKSSGSHLGQHLQYSLCNLMYPILGC